MTERSRHKLFETFAGLVDDEQAVEEMLSYFPARDVEEPVTKEFLRAEFQTEVGVVRLEVSELRTEMHQEFGSVRTEVSELRTGTHQEFGSVRAEIAELRTEMHQEFGSVRTEIAELRAEMHQMMRTAQTWFVGTAVSLAGLMLAITRFA